MDQLVGTFDRFFFRHRWTLHLIYWMFILCLYVVFFGRPNNSYFQTSIFVLFLLPVAIATTYFLNYFLVPRFLLTERYGFFILYLFYTLLGSILLQCFIMVGTFIAMADFNVKKMSAASVDVVFLTISLSLVVCIGMVIKLVIHRRNSQVSYEKLQRERVEAELKFLKAQLNPHFLFNTLNNLYYLTIEKSDMAPAAVLQLSEMLDYAITNDKNGIVPVEKEWSQALNYIALETLRCHDRVTVDTSVRGELTGWSIAPMTLITLVENAFKHGVLNHAGKAWIKVSLITSPHLLDVTVSNSRAASTSGKGIGLQNLQQQMRLLYEDRFKVHIHSDDNEYSINITISANGV